MNLYIKKYGLDAIVILLALILAGVIIWFSLDVKNLNQQGLFRNVHHHKIGTNITVLPAQIEGWMTFRYINYIFKLPPNYLNTKLNIANSTDLNSTLNKYAGAHKLNSIAFVESVRKAVTEFNSGGVK